MAEGRNKLSVWCWRQFPTTSILATPNKCALSKTASLSSAWKQRFKKIPLDVTVTHLIALTLTAIFTRE